MSTFSVSGRSNTEYELSFLTHMATGTRLQSCRVPIDAFPACDGSCSLIMMHVLGSHNCRLDAPTASNSSLMLLLCCWLSLALPSMYLVLKIQRRQEPAPSSMDILRYGRRLVCKARKADHMQLTTYLLPLRGWPRQVPEVSRLALEDGLGRGMG